MIHQNYHVGGLGGRGGASGSHSDTHISRSKRRRIIDAIPYHHNRTVFSLREHNQNFLVRSQPRTYRVDSQACGNRLRYFTSVARCENNPMDS